MEVCGVIKWSKWLGFSWVFIMASYGGMSRYQMVSGWVLVGYLSWHHRYEGMWRYQMVKVAGF